MSKYVFFLIWAVALWGLLVGVAAGMTNDPKLTAMGFVGTLFLSFVLYKALNLISGKGV